jgi:hypothetical protein
LEAGVEELPADLAGAECGAGCDILLCPKKALLIPSATTKM